jgi:hypothetical protein
MDRIRAVPEAVGTHRRTERGESSIRFFGFPTKRPVMPVTAFAVRTRDALR